MNKFKLLSVALGLAISGSALAQSTPMQNYGDEMRLQYWTGTGNSATHVDPAWEQNLTRLYFYGNNNALNITNPRTTQNVNRVSIFGSQNTSDTGLVKIFGDDNIVRSDWVYANDPSIFPVTGQVYILGDDNIVDGTIVNVVGEFNRVTGTNTSSFGNTNTLGSNVLNFGNSNTVANGGTSIGFGNNINYASAGGTPGGIAIGNYNVVNAACVAIGQGSECNENRTVSFGRTGTGSLSRLIGVAYGRADDDAATVGQLRSVTGVLGGNADFNNGLFTGWNVNLKGISYFNVHDALVSLDGRLTTVENNPGGGTGSQGPQGPAGPQGPQGPQGPSGQDGADGQDGATGGVGGTGPAGQNGIDGLNGLDGRSAYEVAVDDGFTGSQQEWLESLQGRDGVDGLNGSASVTGGKNITTTTDDSGVTTISLNDNVQVADRIGVEGGPALTRDGIDAAGRKITGVAPGSVSATSTDAVNGAQLYQVQQDFNDRWENTNRRMDRYDEKLNGLGAQMAAMSMMALAGGGGNDVVGGVKFTMGVGAYGNQAAGAMGWRMRASEKVVWSGGLTFGSGGAKVGGGVGFSVDLGN